MKSQTILSLMAVAWLAGCSATTSSSERTQLTTAEVQATFIDHSWRGPRGRFFFQLGGGAYTYQDDSGWSHHGSYTLLPNGVIKGTTTRYTFYRMPDGSYVYYHSHSGRYYPAKPVG
ncbi:hypothetical protein [Allomesorhizobium camelthorni]|uniref:DUF995 domain-containing protein n=1 Tax=Allomesorhizobium camelthorni TaxID=475069 RepID=A0A6G4WH11_9HYPH|nr:hypothetical protein [Mesorhizobium camelthorni]NGO53483.1 hypothetical protein [Mesorhizobium camelthorni]